MRARHSYDDVVFDVLIFLASVLLCLTEWMEVIINLKESLVCTIQWFIKYDMPMDIQHIDVQVVVD